MTDPGPPSALQVTAYDAHQHVDFGGYSVGVYSPGVVYSSDDYSPGVYVYGSGGHSSVGYGRGSRGFNGRRH